MKILVDTSLCQGHSVCVAEAPEIFDVLERGDGYPQVNVLVENPDQALRAKVEAAAKYCPNHVITIIEQ